MALIEVVLHGWDLARSTGHDLELSPELAADVRRSVMQTAELGRQLGVYGPEVVLSDGASDLELAMGTAGRNPQWRA